MGREDGCIRKQEVIGHFPLEGTLISSDPYGNGHINDTFILCYRDDKGVVRRAILQRMSCEIFKDPPALMENILGVTSFLRKKIIENGGDPERETLNVISTDEGLPYYRDGDGNYWRCYKFIENSISYDTVENPEDFYRSGVAFGHFQRLLADYPAKELHETIEGFHDTVKRFETFKRVVAEDRMGRVASAGPEIQFVLDHEADMGILGALQQEGKLPLRVTHNDTKLNNILMDTETGKALCIIDLDTVMPGLAVNDFGDSIRFGANTAAEDETDLSKVSCDLELFRLYTEGFLEGCAGSLTDMEIRMLPMGAKIMTLECGMRFLADYLEGDVYFKIHRERHNLDRARTQFALVADMEQKWDEMEKIVSDSRKDGGKSESYEQ